MTTRREVFLNVIKDAKYVEFIEFVKLHNSRNDTFDLNEIVQSLSQKQYGEMWDNLNELCTEVLTSFDLEVDEQVNITLTTDYDNQQAEKLQQNTEILIGIATVALCSINIHEPIITNSLLQVAIMLHGILLSVPESCSKLQSITAHLCETWFLSDLDDKDQLVTCMLPYFIIRSLTQGLVVDVKRLWSLRQGLLLMDFEDESSISLKSFLQQCLIHPLFLRVDEGRRFLSYLFGMHPDFIDELHKTIKNQIPSCPMNSLVFYGEVYFKAWRASKDLYLEKIETNCIQDLMFHAIHAQSTGRASMASRLKKVLGYFHQHKKHREVDKMLLKLYEPIIWRACKVANPSVRNNAAAILFDVFPLEDPDANVAQTDQLMQRQFDVIGDFLDDPSPTVRATAIHGVFHISALFWELIPVHVVKELITKIIQTGAYDVSAMTVRVAVFKGISYVLENRLCHPLLKSLLPNLKNLIHDNSEKVRIAFLDMLLKVKGIRFIKFWTIVPMEHLLSQLEVEESSPVIRRLVKLLMNSFHPTHKENDDLIFDPVLCSRDNNVFFHATLLLTRCIELWNTNPKAARNFYQYVHLQLSLPSAVKFLVLLCNFVLHYSRNQKTDDDSEVSNDNIGGIDKENDENIQTDRTQDSNVDINSIAGLLETCTIVWEGIKDQLEQKAQEHLKTKLVAHFSKAIPKLLQSLEGARCQSTLVLLAANLSPDNNSKLSQTFLSKLSSMNDEAASDVYCPLLECLCSWGKASEVIDLIDERIKTTLQDNVVKQNQGKKRKSVNFSLPLNKSRLALEFVDWLMVSQSCRTHIFQVGKRFKTLTETLSLSMKSIGVYLKEDNVCEEKANFLKMSFETYCRARIHLYEQESQTNPHEESSSIIVAFEEILSWCEDVLLKHINNNSSEDDEELTTDDKPKRGRATQQYRPDAFVTSILKTLLGLLAELVMLGVTKCHLNSSLAELTSALVKYENAFTLLPDISKLMYQITQEIAFTDENGMDVNPIKTMFKNILKSATNSQNPNKLQILTCIRSAVVEIIKISHQNRIFTSENLTNSLLVNIMEAIMEEFVGVLEENPLMTNNYNKDALPVTSNFLLELLLKSKFLLRIFLQEIHNCLTSGNLHDTDYQTISFLLWIFMNDGQLVENVKTCLCEMETILEQLLNDRQENQQYLLEARRLVRESLKLGEVTCQNI